MSSESITYVGPHRVWMIPPNILVTDWQGDPSEEDMRALYALYDRILPEGADIYACSIMSHSGMPTPAARRVAASSPQSSRFRAMAFVGASFHFRVIIGMVVKAQSILSPHQGTPSVGFFDTLPEAVEWLTKQQGLRPGAGG